MSQPSEDDHELDGQLNGTRTPEPLGDRHLRFIDQVGQARVVLGDGGEDGDDVEDGEIEESDEDEDEDDDDEGEVEEEEEDNEDEDNEDSDEEDADEDADEDEGTENDDDEDEENERANGRRRQADDYGHLNGFP